jgi:hypothetical protein
MSDIEEYEFARDYEAQTGYKVTTTVEAKYRPIANDGTSKLVKDNRVALLLTDSYHTHVDEFRYDPTIITMVLENRDDEEITKYIQDHFGQNYRGIRIGSYGNVEHFKNRVRVKWLPIGTLFKIKRCADDGESLVTVQYDMWNMA